MKLLCFLLLAGASLGALSSFACPVEDPNGVLKTFLASRTPKNFSSAFPLGDQNTFHKFQEGCQGYCGTVGDAKTCVVLCRDEYPKDADFTKKVAEVTDEGATVVISNGASESLIRSEYEAASNSVLLKALQDLDLTLSINGKVIVDSTAPIDFKLADGTTIPATQVLARFIAADGQFPLEYQVGTNVLGISELLFWKVGSCKIFKVKTLTNSSPTGGAPVLAPKICL